MVLGDIPPVQTRVLHGMVTPSLKLTLSRSAPTRRVFNNTSTPSFLSFCNANSAKSSVTPTRPEFMNRYKSTQSYLRHSQSGLLVARFRQAIIIFLTRHLPSTSR